MYEKIKLEDLYTQIIEETPNLKVTKGVANSFKQMKMMYVPFESIVIDKSFQREPVKKNLKKICSNFDVKKIKPILCFKDSSNSYYVYDGQHTSLACKHNGITQIPGFVYESDVDLSDVDIQDLGRELFKSSNTNNEKISTFDKFKSKLSDKDPAQKQKAVDIFDIFNRNKVTMSATNPNNISRHIVKVGHIEKIYSDYGKVPLENSLKFILDVLPNDKLSEDCIGVFAAIFSKVDFTPHMLDNMKRLLIDNDKLNIQTFQHNNPNGLRPILDESSESYGKFIEYFKATPSRNSDWKLRMRWMIIDLYNDYYPNEKINIGSII